MLRRLPVQAEVKFSGRRTMSTGMTSLLSSLLRLSLSIGCAACITAPAAAQTVAWAGSMGERVLLVIDGRAQVVAAGSVIDGVRVLRVGGGAVEYEAAGVRQRVTSGSMPVVLGAVPSDRAIASLVLRAGADQLYHVDCKVNGRPMAGVIDTGASLVSMSTALATSLGVDWSRGRTTTIQTANGRVQGWSLRLARLSVGTLEARDVEAVVLETELPHLLIGNSFLRRYRVLTEDSQLTLARAH